MRFTAWVIPIVVGAYGLFPAVVTAQMSATPDPTKTSLNTPQQVDPDEIPKLEQAAPNLREGTECICRYDTNDPRLVEGDKKQCLDWLDSIKDKCSISRSFAYRSKEDLSFTRSYEHAIIKYIGHGCQPENIKDDFERYLVEGGTLDYDRTACAEATYSWQEDWLTYFGSGKLKCNGFKCTIHQTLISSAPGVVGTPITYEIAPGKPLKLSYASCKDVDDQESEVGGCNPNTPVWCMAGNKPIQMKCCLSGTGHYSYQLNNGGDCAVPSCKDVYKAGSFQTIEKLGVIGQPCIESKKFATSKPWSGCNDVGKTSLCCEGDKGKIALCCKNRIWSDAKDCK